MTFANIVEAAVVLAVVVVAIGAVMVENMETNRPEKLGRGENCPNAEIEVAPRFRM